MGWIEPSGLEPLFAPGVINRDATHHLGGSAEKILRVFPFALMVVGESQIRFWHTCEVNVIGKAVRVLPANITTPACARDAVMNGAVTFVKAAH
jgi:hypothetical protein